MTNYLERLKAKGEGKPIPEAPSKGSKAPFEGFEGDRDRGFCRRETVADAVTFEERAAICEHDGGLSRSEAEVLAALHAAPLPLTISEDARSVVIDAAARFLDRRKRNRA
jgi:hypothetical protein